MKNKLPKKGDLVRVINPLLFVRCGYPMSKQEAVREIKKYIPELNELFEKILSVNKKETNKLSCAFKGREDIDQILKFSSMGKIISELAYGYMKANKFGGKERKIYCHYAPKIIGEVFRVVDTRMVNTGTYYPPSGGYDTWTGEYDYEGGGLSDMKRHKLIKLESYKYEDYRRYYDIYPELEEDKGFNFSMLANAEWRVIMSSEESKEILENTNETFGNLHNESEWIEAVNVKLETKSNIDDKIHVEAV